MFHDPQLENDWCSLSFLQNFTFPTQIFLALVLSFLSTIKHLMRVVCSPLPHLSFALQLTVFCLWPYPALKLPSLRSNIFLADKPHVSHLLLNLGSQHPLTQLATPSGKLSLALASWGLLPLCQLILRIHFLCSSTSLPKAFLFSHLIHRSWVVSFFSHVGHLRNPAQTLPSIQYKS